LTTGNPLFTAGPTIPLKIRNALGECLKRDPATILPNQHLREDLGLDSMAVIELLYQLEETFGLQIPNEDLAGLTNVGHVMSYVEKRLRESGAPAPVEKVVKSSEPKSTKKF